MAEVVKFVCPICGNTITVLNKHSFNVPTCSNKHKSVAMVEVKKNGNNK